jgi:hypothetical protein
MDPHPAEPTEVHIARLPGRKIVRQVAPRASGAQYIHDTVDDLAHVHGSWSAAWPSRGHEWSDQVPLRVGQIAGIRPALHRRSDHIRWSLPPSSPSSPGIQSERARSLQTPSQTPPRSPALSPWRAPTVAFQESDPVGPRSIVVSRLNLFALAGYGLVVALSTLRRRPRDRLRKTRFAVAGWAFGGENLTPSDRSASSRRTRLRLIPSCVPGRP